jgi:hypothetical protein
VQDAEAERDGPGLGVLSAGGRDADQAVGAASLDCRGQCVRTLTRPSANVEFVHVGFDFEFNNGDHHYVWVPRTMLDNIARLSPTADVHGVGVVSAAIPSGSQRIDAVLLTRSCLGPTLGRALSRSGRNGGCHVTV